MFSLIPRWSMGNINIRKMDDGGYKVFSQRKEGERLTFKFTPRQREEMVQCFGELFTDSLSVRLADYAERWRLTNITLIE